MKPQKLPSGTLALLGVFAPGAIGLSVVARALMVYMGHDPLASLLVVAMGVGFSVGLVELVVRVRRAVGLEREALSLPSEASEAALDRASPPLAAMLRSRLEQTPLPASGEAITPYLVGLMVMLGLLGTLLGLFETLRGAGDVLTASGNVDALRTGLTGPMRGLTRSFGCSAAGVSASAMLGLAAVLVRRREGRALRAVLAYAAGPLRALSPVRRQLGALDKLAAQGDSLPRAADALALAAERLGGLAERWERGHQQAADAQQKSLSEAFDKLQAQLTRTASEAGKAVTESVAPVMKQLVTQMGETASQHMARTLEALEKDLTARQKADAEVRAVLRDELAAMRTWVEEDARKKSDDTQARLAAFDATIKRHADEQAALLTLTRDQAAQHVAQVAEVTSTLASSLADTRADERERLTGLRAELERQNAALASQWAELADAVGKATERTRGEEEARLARLDAMTQRFGAELGQLAAAMAEQLGARLERERIQTERNDQAMAQLAQSGRALEEALGRQELAVQTLLEGGAEQLARIGTVSQEGVRASLEKLAAITDQQASRFTDFEAHLAQSHTALAEKLGQELTAQAERLGQGLTGTVDMVREAAAVLQASSVEMGAVAELFAKSVEKHREAAQGWLESLGDLEGAVERAGRGAAADALGDQLASTQEVFARQLQFQRELFEQLRSLRMGPAPQVREEHDVSA